MKTIEISSVATYLDAAPLEMPVMLIGDTGVGKTQVIKQYAKDNDLYLKTLILSHLEASETLGIPVQTKKEFNGKVYSSIETAIPNWVFDLAEHENAMLYLDEFLCAEPAVMNSFLNFITEKEVEGIDLSHVKIVAATNIGNYTYEPDNNILSRFCMFYVVNTSFQKYLKKKYKNVCNNSYEDEEEKDSIIFDERSLKPRCQEMLCLLKNESLFNDFYQGYTNTTYMPVFHNNQKIRKCIEAYAERNEDYDTFYVSSENIDALAGMLYKTFLSTTNRQNPIDYIVNNIKNIDISTYELSLSLNDLKEKDEVSDLSDLFVYP